MPARGYVILTLVFRKEGRLWTGECLELGTATYGRSIEQVHNELVELVDLHLNTLEQTGERERFLRTHNIRLYPSEPAVPMRLSQEFAVDEASFFHIHRMPVGTHA